jgi:pyridoxamine 5'-phosphate oxidase
VVKDFAKLREEYMVGHLLKGNVNPDPFAMFDEWLQSAIDAGVSEPNAMAFATATPDGRPSTRTLLLKGFDERGFEFYTNYESQKGRELAVNPRASALFWWGQLRRQVRIEGTVAKLTPAESDAYYQSRPKEARLGAWVSHQSSVIASRAVLEERFAELQAEYADRDPERPPYWGGYRLTPTLFEFWQGGLHRLHDRLQYTLDESGGWTIVRLAP